MKDREEPSATSIRPTQLQRDFDLLEDPRSGDSEPRGQSYAAAADPPALSQLQEDLMELIVSPGNMERAWKQVRANRGSAGVDGMTIASFPDFIREHWPAIRQQLLEGTYRPQPVRRVSIPKSDGGQRMLGIPTVLDRVIQQAVAQVLTPIFDPHFSESSFGFRPNRSAHGAIKQVQRTIRQGNRYVVDVDLSKFFDQVSHDVLMSRVARRVFDKRVLRLIGRYLRAGVMVDGVKQPTDVGTPQGGPLSPLLSNILLDDLDRELERRELPFARYADDFVILVRSYRAARKVMASVSRFVTRKLKLVVNEQKSAERRADGVEFLGFVFRTRRAEIRVSAKNFSRLKTRVREITSRNRSLSPERMLGELSRYLRGWMGYFGLASTKNVFTRLDQWIRRRVRMYLWKQWRLPRTRIQKLTQLGVRRDLAITHGASGKGYWRLAKTLGGHVGMTKRWLRSQGLVFLRYLWSQLAPLRRTA